MDVFEGFQTLVDNVLLVDGLQNTCTNYLSNDQTVPYADRSP